MNHTPIDNLAHAISCNSGDKITGEGFDHLLEAAKEVVEHVKLLQARNAKFVEALKGLKKIGILMDDCYLHYDGCAAAEEEGICECGVSGILEAAREALKANEGKK